MDYTTALDAIKILLEEKWVVKTAFCAGKSYQVNSSVVDFVNKKTLEYPNTSILKERFFHQPGAHFVQTIEKTKPDTVFSYIEPHLENLY